MLRLVYAVIVLILLLGLFCRVAGGCDPVWFWWFGLFGCLIPLCLWCFDLLLDCALFGLGCGDFCDLVLGLPVWGVVFGIAGVDFWFRVVCD